MIVQLNGWGIFLLNCDIIMMLFLIVNIKVFIKINNDHCVTFCLFASSVNVNNLNFFLIINFTKLFP